MNIKGRAIIFFLNPTTIIITYICIASITAILNYFLGDPNSHINNFIIYKSSFKHFSDGLNLYIHYPGEYFDLFLYGPLFSFLIAPFTWLPTLLGVSLWNILNGLLFLFAINQLPGLSNHQKSMMAWLTLNSCITSFSNVQIHGVITALIILSYSKIQKGQDHWGTFFIVLGTLLKIYGIVGLVFFLFSKNKPKFIFWGIVWAVLLFFLPVCFSSFNYIVQCYKDWWETLMYKNSNNMSLNNMFTDISVMGMVRRISNDANVSSLFFMIPSMIIFCFLFLRFPYFKKVKFQLLVLSSVLLMVVLANTNTEASTLLIGFAGVSIWYITSQKLPIDHFLFFFALIFSSFGPTDLMPKFIRDEYLRKYALMAFPMFLVWIKINYEILFSYKGIEKDSNLLAND